MCSELILVHYLDVSNTWENNIKCLCLRYYMSPSYSASIFLLSLKKPCALDDVRITFIYQRKMKKKTLAEADEPEQLIPTGALWLRMCRPKQMPAIREQGLLTLLLCPAEGAKKVFRWISTCWMAKQWTNDTSWMLLSHQEEPPPSMSASITVSQSRELCHGRGVGNLRAWPPYGCIWIEKADMGELRQVS